jgi:hypothetical protein
VGTTSNTELVVAQQECRHKLVHHNAANVATKLMTQDAPLQIVHKTGRRNDMKEHAVGCEYIHIEEDGGQLTV